MPQKTCGDCAKHLKPGECPRAEYSDRETNLAAAWPQDPACEEFEPKKKAGGTPVGRYRLKKRGNKAFLFNEEDKPVDSCNLDSVDGPRFKRKLVETYNIGEKEVNRATASFSLALQSVKKKRETQENEEPKEEDFDEETINKAWELLRDPAFFYKLGWVFEYGFVISKLNKPRFIIGEERNKRLLGPLLKGASKLGMTSITKLLGDPATAKDTMGS